MQDILAAATLIVGLSSAATGPVPSSLPFEIALGGGNAVVSSFAEEALQGSSPDMPTTATPGTANSTAAADAPRVPLDQLCDALLTSAEANDLPVAFFANLIWQESRLRNNAVSPKGALGIAQFMPSVAAESGLQNPFDPLQALPASARLLHALRDRFGNLGFVAAAYNAGAKRVTEWLERQRQLPRETRGYVIGVTGRSVEQWKTMPPDDTDLRFVPHLPCREMPAFAALAQAQQAKATQEKTTQEAATQEAAQAHDKKEPGSAPTVLLRTAQAARLAVRSKRVHLAERASAHAQPDRNDRKREQLAERTSAHAQLNRDHERTAVREHDRARREARERIRHAPHERRRRV